jgi:pyrroloquinoline quinone biosynthesis protein B
MELRVLGSAAGGGVPQWNCACHNCAATRAGALPLRTQASLAVSGDGESFVLLGASPDVHRQIQATPALHPRPRSPIAGAALPNGDLDAWLGLLSLREWTPLEIWATPVVARDLAKNPALRTLDRFAGHSRWHTLDPDTPLALPGGLSLKAIPAPGKPPLHARRPPDPLDNVGFIVRDERAAVAWFPSVAAPTPSLARALSEVDVLFFDGTFFSESELPDRPARAMGHWPVSESADFLAALPAKEKWLVHVNHSNPLLRDAAALERLGVGIACDGWTWSR